MKSCYADTGPIPRQSDGMQSAPLAIAKGANEEKDSTAPASLS